MYAMFENSCFRKVNKAGFINFVKILGADAKPIAKHVYWYFFCQFKKKFPVINIDFTRIIRIL